MLVHRHCAIGGLVAIAMLVGAVGTAVSASAAPQNRGVIVPGSGAETATGDRWAVVNRNATLARGKGVVAVTRGDTASGS